MFTEYKEGWPLDQQRTRIRGLLQINREAIVDGDSPNCANP